MAASSGSVTVSYVRTTMDDTDADGILGAESDHAEKIDDEITTVGLNPTTMTTTTGRDPQGREEIVTVLIWV